MTKYIDDDGSGVSPKQQVRKKYNSKYQLTYSNCYYVMKNEYIKDTRIRRIYSGKKRKATGYVLITGSPYRDAEGSPLNRSCLHDDIINSAPRIGGEINKSELYRQCSPRTMKDTKIEELEKCECVSSVINISSVLNIDQEKLGNLGILMRIDDGVYVFICTLYSNVLKQHTKHAFFYDSYFSTKEKSACRGAIIDDNKYAPICVLKWKIYIKQRYTEEYV